jgi:hypothetical protein
VQICHAVTGTSLTQEELHNRTNLPASPANQVFSNHETFPLAPIISEMSNKLAELPQEAVIAGGGDSGYGSAEHLATTWMSQPLQSTETGIAAPPLQQQNLSDMYPRDPTLAAIRSPPGDGTSPALSRPDPLELQEGGITTYFPPEGMSFEEFFDTFYQANIAPQRDSFTGPSA